MKKHPILWLIIGFGILFIPSLIYAIILFPGMQEEYKILLASGGIIGGTGTALTQQIPESWKHSRILKLTTSSFTMLCTVSLIQKFWFEILGLIITAIISYIVYRIFKEKYKNERRRKENGELAKDIADEIKRSSDKDSE